MLVEPRTAALAGPALLAPVASAQNPTTPADRTAPAATSSSSSSTLSLQGNWRASKVVGLRVYNDNNESLGTINDLLMDKSGNIKAVVLGVGGFLGVGEHLVAVPFEKISFVDQPIASTGAASTSPNPNRPATSTTTGSSTTSTAPSSTTAATKANPWYPDHALFSATKDELKAMPEFKYST